MSWRIWPWNTDGNYNLLAVRHIDLDIDYTVYAYISNQVFIHNQIFKKLLKMVWLKIRFNLMTVNTCINPHSLCLQTLPPQKKITIIKSIYTKWFLMHYLSASDRLLWCTLLKQGGEQPFEKMTQQIIACNKFDLWRMRRVSSSSPSQDHCPWEGRSAGGGEPRGVCVWGGSLEWEGEMNERDGT